MKLKSLLYSFLFLLFAQLSKAQNYQPDPALRERLQMYATDTHLYPGGTYIYFDTLSKKPYRFSPKDFIAEDLAQPSISPNTGASTNANQLKGVAGNFHLVKDINTLTDANPFSNYSNQPLTTINNVIYFSAMDDTHGTELWRSNGLAEGTYLVKDILPGSSSSNPFTIIASGKYVYFNIYNSPLDKYELWRSDGTDTGTIKLMTTPDTYFSAAANLYDVNGTLYFSLNHNTLNDQLWKSDGTKAGTDFVKDFAPGGTYGNIKSFASANGLLYFVGYTSAKGYGLGRSDGTDTGTYMLKGIDSSVNINGEPVHLTAYNNTLYFSATDGFSSSRFKLWMVDSTQNAIRLAPGFNDVLINNSYYSSSINIPFTISNGTLYLSGNTAETGTELYTYKATDTAAGLQLVKDITAGSGNTTIYSEDITDVNGTVYFMTTENAGTHLYKTNGTSASTTSIKSFADGTSNSNLYNGNGKLFFQVNDSKYGYEPWVSDGTEEGTVILKDIYSGVVSSYPNYFTLCNSKVVFTATNNVYGKELFTSNGSNTELVKDINTRVTSNAYPGSITPFGDDVIMSATTFEYGDELWQANSSGATLLADIDVAQKSGSPRYFTTKNRFAYFIADSANYDNSAVFKLDSATKKVSRLTSYKSSGVDVFAVTDNGNIFYVARNNTNGLQDLIKVNSNGTDSVYLHSYDYVNPIYVATIGNTFYFAASDPFQFGGGAELWKSDGTAAGTVIIKEINPAPFGSSNPQFLTPLNGQLLFTANDGTGIALWKTDGTDAGTIKLKSVQIREVEVSNNSVFFVGITAEYGIELWKTDGTAEGTVIVKDIVSGSGSSLPFLLTDVNGTLFFKDYPSAPNEQIWKTDGTTEGTVMVKNIELTNNNYYSFSASSANKFFFTTDSKLWVSDGTSEGTDVVFDDVLNGIDVYEIAANGNQLYLEGNSPQYGYELFTGDATQTVLPITLSSFNASLQNNDVITQWQTASEINTSYFNVQRSTDGIHFTDAGKVTAKGTGSTYTFPDVNIANLVFAKTIFYRLQIVDKDGSTSLSKIATVNLNLKEAVVLLLPNPVKDKLKIRVNNYSGKAAINVFDANGKKVYSIQQYVQNGNDFIINTSSLQSGVYMVKTFLNGKTVQKKFIKE